MTSVLHPYSFSPKFVVFFPGRYFHQAILMSGSDLSAFAYIRPFWRPREYAARLGREVGCPNEDSYEMVECLKNNHTKPWRMIVAAQHRVEPNVS